MKQFWLVASILLAVQFEAAASTLQTGVSLSVRPCATRGQKLTDWYQIPFWLGGSYQCVQNPAMDLHFYGHRKDSQGNIWHAAFLPYQENCSENGVLFRYELLKRHMVNSGTDKVIVTDRFRVSKPGTKAVATEICISTTITPSTARALHFVSTATETDMRGKVINETKEESDWIRTEPFQNVDVYYERNLKAEFDEFLQESGHPELR